MGPSPPPRTAKIAPMLALLAIAGCSGNQSAPAPTEQELHSRDWAFGGVKGRHLFRCNDGNNLIVDYKDQGLTLEIRRAESDQPLMLTAPSQGLQYQGEAGTASMVAEGIEFQPIEGAELLCKRRTK